MNAMEIRRKQIVELVNQNGYVNFSQIKEAFLDVSEMTLRTDLKVLDDRENPWRRKSSAACDRYG